MEQLSISICELKSLSSKFFVVLGCCDMIVVVALTLQFGISVLNLPNFPTVDEQINKYDVLMPSPLTPILWPISGSAHLTGVYLMVLLAFERYVAICQKHIISMKKTKKYILCIIPMCIFFNIPLCWEYGWRTETFESGNFTRNFTIAVTTELMNNHSSLYFPIYVLGANLIFRFFIPIVCFVLFNFLMIKQVSFKHIFHTTYLF